MYWMYGVILISLFALFYFQDASQTKEVNWTDFEKAALNGDIDKIMVFSEANTAEGFVNDEGEPRNIISTIPTHSMATRRLKPQFPPPTRFKRKSTPGMPLSQPKGNLRLK